MAEASWATLVASEADPTAAAQVLLRLLRAVAPSLGAAAVLIWLRKRRAGRRSTCTLLGLQRCGSTAPKDPLWETCGLSRSEVERFSRQLALPKLGVAGQRALLRARALVVGAGGLGCPVALYLCAAGVGKLGIVDGDTVAVSNLHRQVGHSQERVGENKAESLRRTCMGVNGLCDVVAHPRRLASAGEAAELAAGYDLVVDCTDSPTSRYLLNEAALVAAKPLLAASAVGLSGQIAVYTPPEGPCLRCVFPEPPGSANAAEPVASCEEHGVFGPVCGVIGTLAALEALKLLAGGGLAGAGLRGRLLLYDALDAEQPCRSLRIRRRSGCPSCDPAVRQASVPVASGSSGAASCGRCGPLCDGSAGGLVATAAAPDAGGMGLTPAALRARLKRGEPTALLDVRPQPHFAVAHLAGSVNWPLAEVRGSAEELQRRAAAKLEAVGTVMVGTEEPLVVCLCRRGVDSLRATKRLREAGVQAWNLDGGLLGLAACTEAAYERPVVT